MKPAFTRCLGFPQVPACMALAAALCLAGAAPAQETFQKVDAKEVAKNPQQFWARGIVFEDVLVEHPSGSTLRLDDQTYQKVRLQVLDDCYASEEAARQLRDLPLMKTYLFSGTVVQKGSGLGRGWFGGRRNFVRVINEVSVPADALSEAIKDREALEAALQESGTNVPPDLLPMVKILRSVEQGLFTFASENGVEVASLFDPNSEFSEMPGRLALQEIRRMERTEGLSVQEFLANYSVGLLRKRYAPESVPVAEPDSAPEEVSAALPAELPKELETDWSDWLAPAPPAPEALEAVGPLAEELPAWAEEVAERERIEPLPATVTTEPLPVPEEPAEAEVVTEEVAEVLLPEEPIVLETRWELPVLEEATVEAAVEEPVEVPVVVNPDLEEFPGLHAEPEPAVMEEAGVEEPVVMEEAVETALPEDEIEALPEVSVAEEAAVELAPEIPPFLIPGSELPPEPEAVAEGSQGMASFQVGPFRLAVMKSLIPSSAAVESSEP